MSHASKTGAASSSHSRQKQQPRSGVAAPGHPRQEQPRTSTAAPAHPRLEQPRTSIAAPAHPRLEQPRTSIAAPAHPRLEQPRTSIAAPAHPRLEQPRTSIAAPAHPRTEQPRTSTAGPQPCRTDHPRPSVAFSPLCRLDQGRCSVGASSGQRWPEPPRVLFPEEHFMAVCRDMGQPKLTADSPWKLMTDSSSSVSVYRLLDEKSGLYEYKVYGVIHGCPPERCADVYMDTRYRAKWDRYVKEVSEKIVDGRTAIYWEVKFPFPLTNRDYVFTRERRDLEFNGRKICVVLAKSVVTSKFPEKPGLIRVNHYKQDVAIESDGSSGSKIYMYYSENPGGKVPSWAVNWAAKTAVPNFVKDMQKACLSYQRKRSAAR